MLTMELPNSVLSITLLQCGYLVKNIHEERILILYEYYVRKLDVIIIRL